MACGSKSKIGTLRIKSCSNTVKSCSPCNNKNNACKSVNGVCRSKYITEAAERLAIRRNSLLCCPIVPCFTACKGKICPTSNPLGKLVCPIKEKSLDLTCQCTPCRKQT